MTENVELLKCPACGSPLDPQPGQTVMKCPYCQSTVVVPRMGNAEAPSRTLADKNIGRVVKLARSGDKLEAIKLFRQMTNANLEDAKRVVEAIAGGQSADISQLTMAGENAPDFSSLETPVEPSIQPAWQAPSTPPANPAASRRTRRIVWITVIVVLACIGVAVFAAAAGGAFGITQLGFAHTALSFGKEGTGPGMLNDPRFVGVDGNGNIYVADFNDGRINIFDSKGKYLNLINLGSKVLIQGFAVSHDGTLYVSHDGAIHKIDLQGHDTTLEYPNSASGYVYFENLTLGPDGSVYAVDEDEELVRFNPQGTVDLVIPGVFSSVVGDTELDMYVAVDGLGNMYVLGTFHNLVLKYSPQGKYLDQFGGDTTTAAVKVDPGHFEAPDTIAVDGYGRIYVSDIWGIQVFNSDGQYLNFFDPGGVAFGMVFDLDNNLYVASNTPKVVKMTIKKPK